MSSREIAELTGKQHKNVKRDIEKMLSDLQEDALRFEHIYLDVQNRQQIEYL
ncbi:Rha family transcriptional regulator, partial [Salmonella enterica subsp. enterica]|nr:Rha family transcriptional regulator [Salmonella enterica]ECH9346814.1 phage antirepressor protein [Salmonella enterica subsp. enterica]EEA8761004.1 Rha family transcriptional regulator [Salmonella enterica subsp. enterica]